MSADHDTSHGACGRTWKQRGNRTGHCAKCHETFEGLSLFDWHQTLDDNGNVLCRDPADTKWADKGLRLVNGSWRGPELPAGIFGKAKDAPDEWILTDGGLMGGYICSVCGMPVETEPCEIHQPIAYKAMSA